MGKGSAGSSSHTYDYYGSIPGIAALGLVDRLLAVIVDGAEIWPRAKAWKAGEDFVVGQRRKYLARTWRCILNHTDAGDAEAPPNATYWEPFYIERGVSPDDSRVTSYTDDYVEVLPVGGRRFKFFWGTQTQEIESYFNGFAEAAGEFHPDYKGVAYIVLKNFWLGREKSNAPNVEVVSVRAPNQSIITGSAAELNDSQANLVSVFAELLTSAEGVGLSSALLDTDTFQDAADALDDRPELVACSPLFSDQDSIRSVFSKMREIADLYVRWNHDSGKMEIGAYPHGAAPSTYTTLTIDDMEAAPQFTPEGWAAAYTRCQVTCKDRTRAFKDTAVQANDLRAMAVLGEQRAISRNEPWITRLDQASMLASRILKVDGRPQVTGKLSVRRTKGLAIRPGDFVLLDIDLEPGGSQLLQYFRVIERTVPYRGPVSLSIDAEENLAPIPVVTDTPLPETVDDVPDFAHVRVIPTLPKMATNVDSVMVLAERPADTIIGADVWFDTDSGGDYQRLDALRIFGTRATLRSNHTNSTTTIQVTVPDQIDLDVIAEQPGDLEAGDDGLLAILVEMDGSDIKEGTDGYAFVEAVSISAQDIVSGNDYDLTVLRGRQGTQARAFTSANAEVWIIRRSALLELMHASFPTLRTNRAEGTTPDTGYFKLQGFTSNNEIALADATANAVLFPIRTQSGPTITVATPATLAGSVTSPYPASVTIAATASDPDSNLVGWRLLIDDHQLDEQVFSPTDSSDIDATVNISDAGTHLIKIQAFDATGLTAEVIITITAAAGTAKVAIPTAWQNGRKLSLTAKGVFGPVELRCDTPGATIQWREDVFGSKGSFVTYDPADQNTWPQGRLLQHISGDDCAGWHFDVQGTKTGITSSTVGNYTPQNVDRV